MGYPFRAARRWPAEEGGTRANTGFGFDRVFDRMRRRGQALFEFRDSK